jgi:hypothetical protein
MRFGKMFRLAILASILASAGPSFAAGIPRSVAPKSALSLLAHHGLAQLSVGCTVPGKGPSTPKPKLSAGAGAAALAKGRSTPKPKQSAGVGAPVLAKGRSTPKPKLSADVGAAVLVKGRSTPTKLV